MSKCIGVLTAGGDCPGLNAALRGLGKAAQGVHGMHVVGFRDGFRGLMENRSITLERDILSGILTFGGTILGTSRDKPQSMQVGGENLDMTDALVKNYERNGLDALVCIGGGGTQKNAYHLHKHGLNVITLPKTIDNDVAATDTTIGFHTALEIATEAIDRLHSTAHSHHRIIVVEVMGHNAGWLALGAGQAGGADVILIPEIPYQVKKVAEAIRLRSRGGKGFSIVAVAEGAVPAEESENGDKKRKAKKKDDEAMVAMPGTLELAKRLEQMTGLEARITILGHLQRGGCPSAVDRILATRLGTACADFLQQGKYGVMLAVRGEKVEPVALEEVVGGRREVPRDHPWIISARRVGTCFGD